MTEPGQDKSAVAPKTAGKRAPTLYIIGVGKVLKGLFVVFLAIAAYNVSGNDLPSDLQHWLHILGLNPERKFWSDLAVRVGNLTEHQVVQFAVGCLIYSLFSLVEGVGLVYRVKWIGYLTIGESAFFIPIEVHHLLDKFSWSVFVILLLNIAIVWYLYANRRRLFSHSGS